MIDNRPAETQTTITILVVLAVIVAGMAAVKYHKTRSRRNCDPLRSVRWGGLLETSVWLTVCQSMRLSVYGARALPTMRPQSDPVQAGRKTSIDTLVFDTAAASVAGLAGSPRSLGLMALKRAAEISEQPCDFSTQYKDERPGSAGTEPRGTQGGYGPGASSMD